MSESDTKVDLFAALQSLCDAIPKMRTGQVMAAVGELCADLHGRGLWDADDEELLEAVWQFHRDFNAAKLNSGSQDFVPVATPDGAAAEQTV